ncbi:peptidoglycan-binding protein, partial [Alkalibaculum bacchi]|uniref:peptidoglycan-binding domain-containing protein n=1 Tax=Alkalibaculum bacchi TaxID=645887 RepID=UPI0026EE2657
MKLVKNLGTYCMIMIFVMTLTSSFLVSSEDVSKIGDVRLKEEKMKKVFYSSSSKMDGNTQVAKKEEKKEKEDSQPSTSTSGEVAYEGLYENKPSVNEAGYTLGDSSEEILAYQKLLYYLDYLQALPEGQYKGIPGGNFEKTTETAVKEYQTKEKLQATGTLDKETQGSLISKPIEFKVGKSGDEIQSYQLILYYLDYIKEYPKGNFDNLTETAVKSYQEDRKLDDTGILTQETQKSLKSEALEYLAHLKYRNCH